MAVAKKSGKEQGAWYEIKVVTDIIKLKEAQGKDASFERGLLRAWSKHKGYELAKQALAELSNH